MYSGEKLFYCWYLLCGISAACGVRVAVWWKYVVKCIWPEIALNSIFLKILLLRSPASTSQIEAEDELLALSKAAADSRAAIDAHVAALTHRATAAHREAAACVTCKTLYITYI
jgi:hypothetical protein